MDDFVKRSSRYTPLLPLPLYIQDCPASAAGWEIGKRPEIPEDFHQAVLEIKMSPLKVAKLGHGGHGSSFQPFQQGERHGVVTT